MYTLKTNRDYSRYWGVFWKTEEHKEPDYLLLEIISKYEAEDSKGGREWQEGSS